MKFALFFLLACVAMAAAAPQYLSYPAGYIAPVPAASTLVAGPTVYNSALAYGARYITPGYVGPAYI